MSEHADTLPAGPTIPVTGSATPVRSGGKGRVLKPLLLATVVIVAAGYGADAGLHYWTVGRFEESTDDAYVKADSSTVSPKVSGYLQTVFVTDNQAVKANQPLAQIDNRDYAVALKQAKANVAGAEATIETNKASIDQQQAVIDQAKSSIVLDQANLVYAEQENSRFVTLARQGAGSVENAQQAVSKLAVAKATLQHDAAAVTAAEKQMDMLKTELAKAEVDLSFNQAAEEQAELNLSYTTIVAPFDGVIGNRTLRVGQYVQAGTALMNVVPLSSVYVVANFKETQLTDMRPGQTVEIAVDSFPDAHLRGKVDSIAPASGQEFALLPPDNATGNFTKIVQRVPVKITFAGDDTAARLLLPGMSVIPTVHTGNAVQAP